MSDIQTVYLGVVNDGILDHCFHSATVWPSLQEITTVCGKKLTKGTKLRGMVMVPGDKWNPCRECLDLPPYFAS